MKLIKKMIAASLALALVLSMSGCYWEGKTKWRSEQLLLNELEEKYNEEFIIRQIGVSSARSGGPLVAYCSPKDDKELVFEVELYQFGDSGNYTMYDMYIQSIVRREMKEKIDDVLSKYYDSYASEIYVWGLTPSYDSGIKNASEASIETFTQAIPDENMSNIWIVLDEDEVGEDYVHTKTIVSEIVDGFHYTQAGIDCYFVPNDILEKAIDVTTDDNPDVSDMRVLVDGKYPVYEYHFWGATSTLKLLRTSV